MPTTKQVQPAATIDGEPLTGYKLTLPMNKDQIINIKLDNPTDYVIEDIKLTLPLPDKTYHLDIPDSIASNSYDFIRVTFYGQQLAKENLPPSPSLAITYKLVNSTDGGR